MLLAYGVKYIFFRNSLKMILPWVHCLITYVLCIFFNIAHSRLLFIYFPRVVSCISTSIITLQNNGSTFDESDIALFEAFAIFCGIGIHNTKMYEGAIKMMAKQKVALDCLSYHASASQDDTEALYKAAIPSADNYQLSR